MVSSWRVIAMGGGRDIGRVVTSGLAERFACVAAWARNQNVLDTTLGAFGRMLYPDACNVADAGSVPVFVSAETAGPCWVEVLVNDASALVSSDAEAGWSVWT